MTISTKENTLGKVIKQRRLMAELTLSQLSSMSGISISHLGRIERGERSPSAHILRKIAKPLGFDEDYLFTFAGFLSPKPETEAGQEEKGTIGRLDPYVAGILAQEPIEVQRSVVAILILLRTLAKY